MTTVEQFTMDQRVWNVAYTKNEKIKRIPTIFSESLEGLVVQGSCLSSQGLDT